jgi:hypothetical protein
LEVVLEIFQQKRRFNGAGKVFGRVVSQVSKAVIDSTAGVNLPVPPNSIFFPCTEYINN